MNSHIPTKFGVCIKHRIIQELCRRTNNRSRVLKDVRAKIFHLIDFFKILLQSDNELLAPEMQKKLGVTVFVSDIERVENYPDFDKLAHVIQHGLQWFIVKNVEGESTEANELSLIL